MTTLRQTVERQAVDRQDERVRLVVLWEQYVSGPGLTVTLTAAVLLGITWPIHDAQWVAMVVPVPVVALLGLGLAFALVRSGIRLLSSLGMATTLGLALMAIAGLALVPGSGPLSRTNALIWELTRWVQAIPTDEVRAGLVTFAVLMTGLAWLLGFGGGWLVLRRAQGWPLILTGALVLLLVLANLGPGRVTWLGLFMGSSALLLIHLGTVRRLITWRGKRLSFDPVTVLSQSAFILGLGLVAALVASALPTPQFAPFGNVSALAERSMDPLERHFSRLFNALPARFGLKSLVYNDEVSLRGNPRLTNDLLFTVSGETASYWRARTYSEYTGRGWEAGDASFLEFQAIQNSEYTRQEQVTHYFRLNASTDTFLSGGLPVGVSERAEALVFEDAPGDILQIRLSREQENFPMRANLRYTSVGVQSTATPVELRDASVDYPEWVSERYLQLPEELPERVTELAEEIAEGHDNAYDMAKAVQDYLIRTIPYNLDIPSPPADRDGVDYFLFDLRQGYCDYYASAMTVLVRSLGLPARYVLGYATGRFDSTRQEYRVLDLNYHSWVEVYFPEYGWIPFEPTPPNGIAFGGSGNVRLGGPTFGVIGGDLDDPDDELDDLDDFEEGMGVGGASEDGLGLETFTSASFVLVVFGGVLAVLGGFAWYRLWWRFGQLGWVEQRYGKMLRLAALAGFARQPGQTPNDYAEALAWEMPAHGDDIRFIAAAYARAQYSNGVLAISELSRADESWERLRWALLRRLIGLR